MRSAAELDDRTRPAPGAWSCLVSAIALAAISAAGLCGVALGDTLELRSGLIVQGKFIGGSAMNIRFQVDGQEQIFATKDVLNIGFDDTSDASNSAPQSNLPDAPVPASQLSSQAGPPPPLNAMPQQTAGGNPVQAITIPSGTSILVRMIDSIDSSQNRVGDIFHASLESPLVVGNTVVAPKGADVYGKLSQAKEAGKISGSSELTLEMTGIRINGNIVSVDSTDYDVAGKSRGKQSAERIGGGAVAGAVLGGILGGGKGAAVGATLGAGGGTAVQVLTHGDQVRVPSETLLEFTLQQDVTAPIAPSN